MDDPRRVQRAPAPLAPAALDSPRARSRAAIRSARCRLVGRAPGALGLTLRGIAYAQLGDLELARGRLERAAAAADDARLRARGARRSSRSRWAGRSRARGRAQRGRRPTSSTPSATRATPRCSASCSRARRCCSAGSARRGASSTRCSPPSSRRTCARSRRSRRPRSRSRALGRHRRPRRARPRPTRPRGRAAPAARARARARSSASSRSPSRASLRGGVLRSADLFAIEDGLPRRALLVDACRRLAIGGRAAIPLARRPVLFALLLDARPRVAGARSARRARGARVRRAHGQRLASRAPAGRDRPPAQAPRRPRRRAGRRPRDGYALSSKRDVVVLLPPSDDEAARVALLLGDGASWSAAGPRRARGGVEAHGAARARRARRERPRRSAPDGARTSATRARGRPIASRMLLLGLVPKACPTRRVGTRAHATDEPRSDDADAGARHRSRTRRSIARVRPLDERRGPRRHLRREARVVRARRRARRVRPRARAGRAAPLPVPRPTPGRRSTASTSTSSPRAEILVVRAVRRARSCAGCPRPPTGTASGMAWADGYLWIGQFRESTHPQGRREDRRGREDADVGSLRHRRVVRRRRALARRQRRRQAVRAPPPRRRRHGGGERSPSRSTRICGRRGDAATARSGAAARRGRSASCAASAARRVKLAVSLAILVLFDAAGELAARYAHVPLPVR